MTTLRFFTTSTSEFPTNEDVAHDIVNEGAWAAIVISEGATSALTAARQNGDASYDGSQAIQVYYAQARNEQATGSYLLPLMQAALARLAAQYNARSVAQ